MSGDENTLFIKAAYFYTSWAGKNVFNRPAANQIKLQPQLNCQKTKIQLYIESVFSVWNNFDLVAEKEKTANLGLCNTDHTDIIYNLQTIKQDKDALNAFMHVGINVRGLGFARVKIRPLHFPEE